MAVPKQMPNGFPENIHPGPLRALCPQMNISNHARMGGGTSMSTDRLACNELRTSEEPKGSINLGWWANVLH